jgi:hypothetical protein
VGQVHFFFLSYLLSFFSSLFSLSLKTLPTAGGGSVLRERKRREEKKRKKGEKKEETKKKKKKEYELVSY